MKDFDVNPSMHLGPVIKKGQPDDTYKFLPLPRPTGKYPYRLNLDTVIGDVPAEKLSFHVLGDTGSLRHSDFLEKVVIEMTEQYANEEDNLRFLYHLGDVVYNHGEAEEYEAQFFKPVQTYPGPIFAIAGNHDSDVNPYNPFPYKSLDAFMAVFCTKKPETVAFSGNAERKSMVQPNVYWSLVTPVAYVIGLHCNVPKYGVITPEQRAWFVEELQEAARHKADKAVILCLHHAPYTGDMNHGSSQQMIRFLEGVYSETGVRPDIVFSGHVHNYQRFIKTYPDGSQVPYIVAGAGGYDELHGMAWPGDRRFTSDHALFDGVTLQSYCDDRHGFLKITIEKKDNSLLLTGKYFTVIPGTEQKSEVRIALNDEFGLDLPKNRR